MIKEKIKNWMDKKKEEKEYREKLRKEIKEELRDEIKEEVKKQMKDEMVKEEVNKLKGNTAKNVFEKIGKEFQGFGSSGMVKNSDQKLSYMLGKTEAVYDPKVKGKKISNSKVPNKLPDNDKITELLK